MSDSLVIESYNGPYSAYFDNSALEHLNNDVPTGTHFIIDARIAELYSQPLANVLKHPSVLLIEAAENNKSLEKIPSYVKHLIACGVRHDHTLVAIGGGIIQDITCFLAATMLRGMNWRFFPTTLLAQADSCIGSKSSINCGSAKNILGTFTPPKQINICVDFLGTLNGSDVRSGVGEMLKVHIIDGPSSFDAIAADYPIIFSDKSKMRYYILRSLEIKKTFIERDEFDRSHRKTLNYGHSFGHAIETATAFAIPHGIAITIGMDMANYVSLKLGIGSEEHYHRMHPVLRANFTGFENHLVPMDAFIAAISKDKKNIGARTVSLILIDKNAQVFRDTFPNDGTFRELCAEYLTERRAP